MIKKILLVAGSVVAVAPLTGFAAYITLPASTTDSLFAYAGGLFSDLWVLIAVAIGVPLGFYVIKKVIALIPKK